MRIFLSWSGQKSKLLAEEFNKWILTLPLRVSTFISTEDIASGQRSMLVLDDELEATSYGILFLTKDNLGSKWLHFEAGALAKTVTKARVVPVCFGVKFSEVTGPLATFQSRLFSKDELLKLCKDLNNEAEEKVSLESLEKAFERAYEELAGPIAAILDGDEPAGVRPAPDPIEEVLRLNRAMYERIVEGHVPGGVAVAPGSFSKLWPINRELAQAIAGTDPECVFRVTQVDFNGVEEEFAGAGIKFLDDVEGRLSNSMRTNYAVVLNTASRTALAIVRAKTNLGDAV